MMWGGGKYRPASLNLGGVLEKQDTDQNVRDTTDAV